MTRVFGLTGGIASGKSTVAEQFRAGGVHVINADDLARRAVGAGSAGLAAVQARFGDGVIGPSGELDRKRLAALVFNDAAALQDLNAIVHPRVAELLQAEVLALSTAGHALVCYEVPLLFENKLESKFAPVVLVAASEALQLERASRRDGSNDEETRARIRAQLPLAAKLARADIVIHNDSDLPTLRARSDEALAEVRRRVKL